MPPKVGRLKETKEEEKKLRTIQNNNKIYHICVETRHIKHSENC
jgi:hypothetical protein